MWRRRKDIHHTGGQILSTAGCLEMVVQVSASFGIDEATSKSISKNPEENMC
jgi:hypothetical protein